MPSSADDSLCNTCHKYMVVYSFYSKLLFRKELGAWMCVCVWRLQNRSPKSVELDYKLMPECGFKVHHKCELVIGCLGEHLPTLRPFRKLFVRFREHLFHCTLQKKHNNNLVISIKYNIISELYYLITDSNILSYY